MNVENVYKIAAYCARCDRWSELTGRFQAIVKLGAEPHRCRISVLLLLLFLQLLLAATLSGAIVSLLFLSGCPENILCLSLGAKTSVESQHFASTTVL